MQRVSTWVLGAAALAAVAGCAYIKLDVGDIAKAGDVMKPGEKPGPGETVLEVETFKLDQAEVKDLPGASGGKAVLFDSETAGAETTVPLEKGTYQVTLYLQGTDEDHDAVWLTVAGIENRFWSPDWGKVVAAEPVTVEVTKDGPAKVVLMAAETGVYLDRVVLKKVK